MRKINFYNIRYKGAQMDFNIDEAEFDLEDFIKIFELGSYKSVILDDKLTVKYVNNTFLKAFNCKREELI